MSTVTTSTTTTPTAVVTAITKSWIAQHERIVILSLILLFGGWGLSKYYDVDAAKKDAKYVAAQQIAANDKANSAALAVQTAQTQAQYVALIQSLSAENASLNASQKQRDASGKAQQTTDANLTTVGMAQRWNTIADTLVTASGDTIIVSSVDAHKTLALLEQVTTLAGDLADENKIAANYQEEVQKSDQVAKDLNAQVTGLNTQLADSAKACTAQVAAVKAEGHKNSVKWFKRGFVLGVITGLIGGHAAGI